jgi:hypothetical protein
LQLNRIVGLEENVSDSVLTWLWEKTSKISLCLLLKEPPWGIAAITPTPIPHQEPGNKTVARRTQHTAMRFAKVKVMAERRPKYALQFQDKIWIFALMTMLTDKLYEFREVTLSRAKSDS